MDYEHVDFPSAVRKLAARVGIPVIEERGPIGADDQQVEARHILLQLHGEAAAWFHENLIKREFAEPARKYLKERGITAGIAKRWQLGYAPEEWDAFGSWARGRGYNARDLIASGLVKTKEDADGAAKYLNSPETPLFRKGKILFGLDKTKRSLIEATYAVVCEGQLDLISLFEAGITNVVAPQGTAFTEDQARILKRSCQNKDANRFLRRNLRALRLLQARAMRSQCFASWRCEMRPRENFFAGRTGARF